MKAFLLGFLAMGLVAFAQRQPLADIYHSDGRNTPQYESAPHFSNPKALTGEQLAWEYLHLNASRYQLPADLGNLRQLQVKHSLLGTHYHYQQSLHGIPVEGAEIIVSLDKQEHIYQVFNNTYPIDEAQVSTKRQLDEEQAFDRAWEHLAVAGRLQKAPDAILLYLPTDSGAKLVYRTYLNVSDPMGAWLHWIDADSGEIIKAEDENISRKPREAAKPSGPVVNRKAAFEDYFRRAAEIETAKSQNKGPSRRANGTGNVFDPDPRTTLDNEDLQDGSPGSSFTNAYFVRNLLDLTQSGGVFTMTGPWVDVVDIESPTTPPSTSVSGVWNFQRGNNAFNDAMTYFHLDQSQRYMQSMGFTGQTGIQFLSIEVDTDGVNGDDNSYYSPSGNFLSFGHGCVDDNEDADVILHEYGHAIQRSINASWSGGDTGAMGEGFGDYWAGSYSYSTQNGDQFHPEWIFSWDGHGTGNPCWGGRLLNRTDAMYDPSRTYGAHQSVGNFVSDELWSAPLFRSLLHALDAGYSREQVDQIILQSHFGLGSGLTMRTLAGATIQTAATLFPNTNLAKIFTANFKAQNIVTNTFAFLDKEDFELVSGSGSNGAADPGETVGIQITLENKGSLTASSIVATLTSSTNGVVIQSGVASYANIAAGATGSNGSPFQITLPANHPCGEPVALQLALQYSDGTNTSQIHLPYQMGTGVVDGVQVGASPGSAIPDNQSNGITSQIAISGSGAMVSANLNIDLEITHPTRSNLDVSLTSPSGTTVKLHDNTGGTSDNLIGNYPQTLTPAQALSAFLGEPLDGTWTLTVADTASGSTGTLVSWALSDFDGYFCGSCAVGEVELDADFTTCMGQGVMLEAALPNGVGPFTYSWTPTTGLDDPTSATPIASPSETTTYQVQITDDNTCASSSETTVYVFISTEELLPAWLVTTAPGEDLDDDEQVSVLDFIHFVESCAGN